MKYVPIGLLSALLLWSGCRPEEDAFTLTSPDGKMAVRLTLTEDGAPRYTVHHGDLLVLEPAALGMTVNGQDLTQGLEVASYGAVESVSDDYRLVSGKSKDCSYRANRRVVSFAAKGGVQMSIAFQVSNDGLAFRYELAGAEGEPLKVEAEASGFDLPGDARAWLHPHAVAQSGWEHTQPSYEENYAIDIPVGTPSTLGQGWSFPALFKTKQHWVLLSETNVGRNYCGTHLGHESPEGLYTIAFPQAPERMGPDTPLFPEAEGSLSSPWRLIVIGQTLAPIVESTLTTDLAAPSKIEDTDWIQPGQSSWSWVVLKDDSTIYPVQKRFIDYAADMNWEYCLVDAQWDTQIGYDSIAALSEYAQSKGVGLQLWYNSNGDWNTAPLSPKDKVTDPEIRRAEFARLRDLGIKGLKIDFFGGDGQSFMNYYQDLMEDAAEYGFAINFHGTTLPRGWHRTYPNMMTLESVKGFEFITFGQPNADAAPVHCTILPFTRNAVGPMDFTPMCFGEVPNIERRTSNAFELALAVLFQSGVQHYAEIPASMARQPQAVVDLLRNLPNRWDAVRYLAGYPGQYAVLARKAGDSWYIAAINGEEQPRELDVDLTGLDTVNEGLLITDGDTHRSFAVRDFTGDKLALTLQAHGGLVLRLEERE